METIAAALAAHLATKQTTIATAIRMVRPDAAIYGFTSHDVSVTIDGVFYDAVPGFDPSTIVNATGAAAGTAELTALHDEEVFTTVEILEGRWKNAAYETFRYNWASPADGIFNRQCGTLGEVTIKQNTVVVELRGLRQYFQQYVGSASSKNCRYRLGSTDKNNGGLCMVDLSAGYTTGTYTLDIVASNQDFTATALSGGLPDDFFGEGILHWLTGNNAGLEVKLRNSFATGRFYTDMPMLSNVEIGDTFYAIAGCRKRPDEDCNIKFSNIINFGGERHRPDIDALTKPPPSSV